MPLRIVATPIGNLADLSPRAREALTTATSILCEDTRRTRELLAALGLPTDPKRLHRLDQHVARENPRELERWIARLRDGEEIALVSDAGTPAISDPGAELVRLALDEGLEVTPIPGPSALAALASVAGFLGNRLVFEGFFARSAKELTELDARLAALPRPALAVFFESPNRMLATAEAIAERAHVWEVARVTYAKELTKRHEKLFAGAPIDALARLRAELEREGERGEWSLAIELSEREKPSTEHAEAENQAWKQALRCVLAGGVSASQSAKIVSQEFGVKKNLVYSEALEQERVVRKDS